MAFSAKSTRTSKGKEKTPAAASADNSSADASGQPRETVSKQPASTSNTLDSSTPSSKYFYELPARLDDLEGRDGARAGWSSKVDTVMQKLIQDRKAKGQGIKSYNPTRASEAGLATSTETIRWIAFPNNCKTHRKEYEGKGSRYEIADVRGNQDEYCEWEVERQGEHLKSVTFTTEVPEYYDHLAEADLTGALLLRQYRRLNPDVAPDNIKLEDLRDAKGAYKRRNRWNVGSVDGNSGLKGRIAHLIRDNNTLQEAAALVVDSTVLRRDEKGGVITDGPSLLLKMEPPVSSNSPERNSDPHIADSINSFSRRGKLVTVANPVGLYIHSFDDSDFETEYGDRVSNMWTVKRKSQDGRYVVRAKFTVPDGQLGRIYHARTREVLKYGSQLAESIWVAAYVTVAEPTTVSNVSLPPTASQPIYSFIEGRQIKPTLVPQATVDELRREPFGAYLASTSKPAITLKDLIATFEDYTWSAFAADEGIGFYNDVVRVRMVLIWIPGSSAKPSSGSTSSKMGDAQLLRRDAFIDPTVLFVALPPFDRPTDIHSEKSILQVASYDPQLGSFNFYDRERTGESRWLYFGSSKDAFEPDTHGLGPFCGHPNGALAMKEMLEPWPHWHSTRAQLDLGPTHPLTRDSLFRNQNTGSWYFGMVDHLAHMVTVGTKKWFQTRRNLDFGPPTAPFPTARRVHQWISHVCMNTTIEIASSTTGIPASPTTSGCFDIPLGFFFNSEALGLVLDGIGNLADDIDSIPWNKYRDASARLGLSTLSKFGLQKNEEDTVAVENEGFVPWKVVKPSFEDIEGISILLETGLLPKNVVAAILMVDFCNPVFSSRRAQLMRYVPSTATYDPSAPSQDKYTLGADLVAAAERGIATYGYDSTSPEAEFVRLARNPHILSHAHTQLKDYVSRINEYLKTPDGVINYMRVAETRRRIFRPPPRSRRPPHPLAEFEMTLPYAQKMDAEFEQVWVIKSDASVGTADPARNVWHPRDNQAHPIASGCPFSQGV